MAASPSRERASLRLLQAALLCWLTLRACPPAEGRRVRAVNERELKLALEDADVDEIELVADVDLEGSDIWPLSGCVITSKKTLEGVARYCGDGVCEIRISTHDRQRPQDRRFVHVLEGGNLTVRNVRLKDGNSELISTLAGGGVGGAVFADLRAWVVFENCEFFGNSVHGGWGGAVYLYGATGVFTDCTFERNYAQRGGGVRIRGDPESKSYAVFIRCVFDNNLALNGAGVDVAHRGNGYFLGCTFQSNSADGEGGAVYLEYSNSQFVNCTWHNNFGKRGQNVYMYAANMGVYPASYAALPSGFDTDLDAEQSNSVAIAANVQPPSLLALRATDSSFEGFEAFVPPPPAPVGVPGKSSTQEAEAQGMWFFGLTFPTFGMPNWVIFAGMGAIGLVIILVGYLVCVPASEDEGEAGVPAEFYDDPVATQEQREEAAATRRRDVRDPLGEDGEGAHEAPAEPRMHASDGAFRSPFKGTPDAQEAAEQESPIHKVHDPLLDADDDPHASDPYDRFHEEEEEEDPFAVPAPVRRGGVRLPPLATDARPLRSALGTERWPDADLKASKLGRENQVHQSPPSTSPAPSAASAEYWKVLHKIGKQAAARAEGANPSEAKQPTLRETMASQKDKEGEAIKGLINPAYWKKVSKSKGVPISTRPTKANKNSVRNADEADAERGLGGGFQFELQPQPSENRDSRLGRGESPNRGANVLNPLSASKTPSSSSNSAEPDSSSQNFCFAPNEHNPSSSQGPSSPSSPTDIGRLRLRLPNRGDGPAGSGNVPSKGKQAENSIFGASSQMARWTEQVETDRYPAERAVLPGDAGGGGPPSPKMEMSRPDSCSSGFSVGGLSNLFAASPLPTPPHSPPQSDAGGVESSSNSMHDSQPRDSRGRATHLNLPTGGSGRSSKQAHGGGNPLLGRNMPSVPSPSPSPFSMGLHHAQPRSTPTEPFRQAASLLVPDPMLSPDVDQDLLHGSSQSIFYPSEIGDVQLPGDLSSPKPAGPVSSRFKVAKERPSKDHGQPDSPPGNARERSTPSLAATAVQSTGIKKPQTSINNLFASWKSQS